MKIVDNSGKNKKSQDQKYTEDYQSWDPLTQSKFIYEINKQAGTPISRPDSYRTADLAICTPESVRIDGR